MSHIISLKRKKIYHGPCVRNFHMFCHIHTPYAFCIVLLPPPLPPFLHSSNFFVGYVYVRHAHIFQLFLVFIQLPLSTSLCGHGARSRCKKILFRQRERALVLSSSKDQQKKREKKKTYVETYPPKCPFFFFFFFSKETSIAHCLLVLVFFLFVSPLPPLFF